ATKYTPARFEKTIIQNIQDTCIRVMQALEFKTIGRIDGFVKKNGEIVIIDPNTLSGMGPASFIFNQAAEYGMSHAQLINHLLKIELENYHMKIDISEKQNFLNQEKKLRVAVLFGGDSNEREISLESGRNVVYKLSLQKYDVIPLFVDEYMKLYKV